MTENFPKENSRWTVKPKSTHFNPACESGCCESHVLVFSGFLVCTPSHAMENAVGPIVILHSPPSWGVRFLSLLCSWQLLPFESSPLIFSPQRLSLSPPCWLPPPASSLLPSLSSITSEPSEHQWAWLTLNPLSLNLQRIFSCLSLVTLSKITQAAILKAMPCFCLDMSLYRTSLLPLQDPRLNYLLLFPLPLLASPILATQNLFDYICLFWGMVVSMYTHTTVLIWSSKNNLQEPVTFFHPADSRNRTPVIELGSKHSHPLNHLTSHVYWYSQNKLHFRLLKSSYLTRTQI